MGERHRARELTLKMLFQNEYVASDTRMPEDADNSQTWAPSVREYALKIYKGVLAHKAALDEIIATSSAHWKITRMALVDLNILRVGAFELIHCQEDIPAAVAIDEAVELAKVFGSQDSASFVNGILDQIRIRTQKGSSDVGSSN